MTMPSNYDGRHNIHALTRCKICGATVSFQWQQLHTRWHDNLARQLVQPVLRMQEFIDDCAVTVTDVHTDKPPF